MDMFGELLPKTAKLIMAKKNFLFGVAMVENAADETAIIEIVPSEQIFEREPVLLAKAKELMPRLQFDEIDVLIVEKIGKNIQRLRHGPQHHRPQLPLHRVEHEALVKKIAVLGLTPETHGNACGIGVRRRDHHALYKEIDIAKTYANIIASTYLDGGCHPDDHEHRRGSDPARGQDRGAREAAGHARSCASATTLEIMDIHVSEPMLPVIKANPVAVRDRRQPEAIKFDAKGNLYPMLGKHREHATADSLSRSPALSPGRRHGSVSTRHMACIFISTRSAAWQATCSSPPCSTRFRICATACSRRFAPRACRRKCTSASRSIATMR